MAHDSATTLQAIDLPIHQNPFFRLGVSPRDDRHHIVAAAEEKSLTLDADACSKARSDLTNPRNRLTAEISWLPGTSPRRAQQLIDNLADPSSIFSTEGLPALTQANLMASAFAALRPDADYWDTYIAIFSVIVDDIDADAVYADINEDRKVAGFPPIRSVADVKEALADQRRVYRDNLRDALDAMPPAKLTHVVTEAVEKATFSGTQHPPLVIDDLIEAYAIGTHSFLTQEATNIEKLINRASAAAPTNVAALNPLLDRLEMVTRNWFAVAKPIQIVANAKGATSDISENVVRRLRGLCLLLNNEHDLIQPARRIVSLCQELFRDVPVIGGLLEEDATALDDRAKQEEIGAKVTPIYKICSDTIDLVKADPTKATSGAENVLATAVGQIKRLAQERFPTDKIRELEDVVAITLTQCAIELGGSFKGLEKSIFYLQKAETFAHDKDVVERVASNLSMARKNHRIFGNLEPIDSAPSLSTINGFGFKVYGNTDHDQQSGSHMATYYFVALFFPIFPISRYRVIPNGNGYRFLGKAPLRPFDKWHLAISLGAICIFLLGAL